MKYHDRAHAGVVLAKELARFKDEKPLIFGLPRGGVPVAFEISRRLHAPMDLLLVRKLAVPGSPELAFGAMSEDEVEWLNQDIVTRFDLSKHEIEETTQRAKLEIRRRKNEYRVENQALNAKGRTVILVDDGLATGATAVAAIELLRRRGAAKIVFAVPVASSKAAPRVRGLCDEFICPKVESGFSNVAEWYEDFMQVGDVTVNRMLSATRENIRMQILTSEVAISVDDVGIRGEISEPKEIEAVKAWIVFAHGSGSSRKSPRNLKVAAALNAKGYGTLLFDLLTEDEALLQKNVFDIKLMSKRLDAVTAWLRGRIGSLETPIGYFGASTGAAAALISASNKLNDIFAIVCRGGRPDLADEVLYFVKTPVLLIVGEKDDGVIAISQKAQRKLQHSQIVVVPNATHLFQEEGALDRVIVHATHWFDMQMMQKRRQRNAVA